MELTKTEKIIAIGGLGGSGTRAVAQILIDAGIYLGDELNKQKDNLIFTRLFKSPQWYKNASSDDVRNRMRIFARYMRGEKPSAADLKDLVYAASTNPFPDKFRFYKKLANRTFNKKYPEKREVWGWKEPNSQIFLGHIKDFFPEIKYIHVLRNGADMAFSKNIQQLKNWGYIYNIHLDGSATKTEIAQKQMDYWIKSSENVISKGKDLFNKNFYLLNHSDLCLKPIEVVEKLLLFLGLEIPKHEKEALFRIPIIPPSFDRYKNFDLSIFSERQMQSVKNLGFSVQGSQI